MRRTALRVLLLVPAALFAAACSSPTAPSKTTKSCAPDHVPWTLCGN